MYRKSHNIVLVFDYETDKNRNQLIKTNNYLLTVQLNNTKANTAYVTDGSFSCMFKIQMLLASSSNNDYCYTEL